MPADGEQGERTDLHPGERSDPLAEAAAAHGHAVADLLRSSEWFDAEWYGAVYPDVAAWGEDPALHYVRHGAAEGRDPGPWFSTRLYLQAYPDVAASTFNPLEHFVIFGFSEGRRPRDDYERWIAQCEQLDVRDAILIRNHVASLAYRPLISVVVPVYDPDEAHFRALIASIQAQLYPDWELCLADDASRQPRTVQMLEELAGSDSRLKLAKREQNGGISAATNTALGLAAGEFVALVDHDDLLHETALYEMAVELNAHPNAAVIYSDSDLVDENGLRSDPYFKPHWNPELQLGQNLISHLGVYRRSLLERLGGLRPEYDGSQDYDLALRAMEVSGREGIRHVPAVLYHWRRDSRTPSFSAASRERCRDAAHRALVDHLRRTGDPAEARINPRITNWTHLVHPLPDPHPPVSIVCSAGSMGPHDVERLRAATDYRSFEIMVAGPVAGENATAALDRIARASTGEVMVLVDSPVAAADPSWLRELTSQALRPSVGAAAPLVHFRNKTIQDAGLVLGAEVPSVRPPSSTDRGYFGAFALARETAAASLTGLAVRKDVYLQAGGLREEPDGVDPAVALCTRIRATGRTVIWTPFAELYGFDDPVQKRRAWTAASRPTGCGPDPYHSPNLSIGPDPYAFSFAPRRAKPWLAQRWRGPPLPDAADRTGALLKGVNRSALILELGPSYHPLAPKADGWNVRTLDHATREELVAKYAGAADVDVRAIEPVDFVWRGGGLEQAVPSALHGTFDVLLASHVVEHTPDLVAFLNAAETLLRPEGVVVLAAPDLRYCFDYLRPLTTTADVVAAHREGRQRHTLRTAFENVFYPVHNEDRVAWAPGPVGRLRFNFPFASAARRFEHLSGALTQDYQDLHAWTFTPAAFALILLELAALGMTDWAVAELTSPPGECEFHVRLRRGGRVAAATANLDDRRLVLLQRILTERGEQIRSASFSNGAPASLGPAGE